MSNLSALRQLGDSEIVGVMLGESNLDASSPEGRQVIAKRKPLSDLMALGIRPFKDEDVERYKKSAVRPYNILATIGAFLSPKRGHMILLHYGAAASAGAGIGCLLATSIPATIVFSAFGVLVGCIVRSVLDIVGEAICKRVAGSSWVVTTFFTFTSRLQRKVPRRVQELAGRIQAVRPDVELRIEYLMLDPFLTVVKHTQYEDIAFRVAVWNEIGFRTTDR